MKLITLLCLLLPLTALAKTPFIIGKDQAPINAKDYATLKAVAANAQLPIEAFRHDNWHSSHYLVGEEGMLYRDKERNGIIDGKDVPVTGLVARAGNSYITDKDGFVIAIQIRESRFSDMRLLKRFEKLVAVDLHENSVSKVELSDLKHLRHLNIFGRNNQRSLIKLSNLPKLAYLFVTGLNTPDFKKFIGLKGLYKANISGMAMESFAGLENLPNLKELDIMVSKEGNIDQARVLKGIPKGHKLEKLKFASAAVTNIDQLAHFTHLKRLELWASHLELKDFSAIGALSTLEDLEVTVRNMTDFSFFKPMPKLKKIVSYHSPFTSLVGLDKAPNLEHLELNRGQLAQIDHLEKNTQLKTLILNGHKLERLTGLSSLTKLKTLDVSLNSIRKIEGLDHTLCLEEFAIASNPVKELDNVYHLPLLYRLNLDDTKIRSFPRWKELKRLHKLTINENQLDPDTLTKKNFWWVNIPIEDFDYQLRTSPEITDEERKQHGCI